LGPLPLMNREGLTPSGGSPPQVLLERRGKRRAAIAAIAAKPVWESISSWGYCAAIAGKRGRIAASGHAVLESVCGVCGVCGYCPAAFSKSQGLSQPRGEGKPNAAGLLGGGVAVAPRGFRKGCR
jgi:hypothetical protein